MPTPDYTLRPVENEDYDFLYQLHRATIRPAVEATWGWDEAFQELHFQAHWDPANRQIVVVAGVDAGTITLDEGPEALFLGLIEIAPNYQGQGLGTALLHDILADAFGRGLDVELHVLKANPRAKRLYERLGFGVTEEHQERYVMRAFCSSENNLEG